MNEWIVSAIVLTIAGLLPLLGVAFLTSAMEATVAVELAGTVAVTILLLLAEGFHRQPFVDIALVLAAISFVGSIAYAHFLERSV